MFEIMINPQDMLNLLKNRRSIRSFQDKPIPDEQIDMILEAGRWTPSASNKQPWEFIVVKNKDIIKKLEKTATYGKFIGEAPILIAIVGKVKQNPRWYVQDTSLASMNMMLMAWSLKIGTCWIGSMDREKAKQILGVIEDDFLLTILPFGYPGEIPKPTPRKDLNKIKKEIK